MNRRAFLRFLGAAPVAAPFAAKAAMAEAAPAAWRTFAAWPISVGFRMDMVRFGEPISRLHADERVFARGFDEIERGVERVGAVDRLVERAIDNVMDAVSTVVEECTPQAPAQVAADDTCEASS